MTAEQKELVELLRYRERARLAYELVVACGPFDLQCPFYKLKQKALDSTTALVRAFEERLSETIEDLDLVPF